MAFIEQLPTTLFPFCINVSNRLIQDFLSSPAFGGTSSNNLFSKISAHPGAELFRGLDRRSFRALASIARRVFSEDSDDGRLISLVISPHAVGVSCDN